MKANKMMYMLLVVSTLSSGSFAQQYAKSYFSGAISIQSANLSQAENRYTGCLKSGNDGVVESALAHVAMLKLMNPGKNLAKLAASVDDIAAAGTSQEIRYKAYLVSNVLRNPELFLADARTDYETPDELFAALSNRMSALIASSMGK